MSRTTSADVIAILGNQYDTDGLPSVDPFIASATVIIDRVVTCATNKGITLTDAELELIERWLAAHFYGVMDQMYQSKTTGRASASFQGKTGMNLDATIYGQQAQMIDPSGCLTGLSKTQKAGLSWLGKPDSEKLSYEERN